MSAWNSLNAGFCPNGLNWLASEMLPPVPQRRPQDRLALDARTTAASLLPPFLTPAFTNTGLSHLSRPSSPQGRLASAPPPHPSLLSHTQGFGFSTSFNSTAGLGPGPFQTTNRRLQPHHGRREVSILSVPGAAQAANSCAEEAIFSPDLTAAISTSTFTAPAIPEPSSTRPPLPPPLPFSPPGPPPPTTTSPLHLPSEPNPNRSSSSSRLIRSLFLTPSTSTSTPELPTATTNNDYNHNHHNVDPSSLGHRSVPPDILPIGSLFNQLATSRGPSAFTQVQQLRPSAGNECFAPVSFTQICQTSIHERDDYANNAALIPIDRPRCRSRATDDGNFKKEEQARRTKTEHRHAVGLLSGDGIHHDTMPVCRKRGLADAHDDTAGPSGTKRRRSRSTTTGISARTTTKSRPRTEARNHAPVVIPHPEDLFALDDQESDTEKTTTHLYDLTKDDNVPEELLAPLSPEEGSSIRLSNFECIICMDSATNLTVTHCGHMFCAQCLHQAMHSEVTKRICPMCRQKLDLRPRDHAPSRTSKTFFHLELKLMPSKRQGKQPARLRR